MLAMGIWFQNEDRRCSHLLHNSLLWSKCGHRKDKQCSHLLHNFVCEADVESFLALMRSRWEKQGEEKINRGKRNFFLSPILFQISSNQRTPTACTHFLLLPSWPCSRRINKTSAKSSFFSYCVSMSRSSLNNGSSATSSREGSQWPWNVFYAPFSRWMTVMSPSTKRSTKWTRGWTAWPEWCPRFWSIWTMPMPMPRHRTNWAMTRKQPWETTRCRLVYGSPLAFQFDLVGVVI